ncbi:hypothetical protein cypCar_00044905 [Cyprinus carpio]|nr:hypothetical protein cypCar_00044905 [Cyprinus carpio]
MPEATADGEPEPAVTDEPPPDTSGPCRTLAPGPSDCGLEPPPVSAPAGGDVSAPALVLEFRGKTVAVVTRTCARLKLNIGCEGGMSALKSLVPARFLTLAAHLVIVITIFWSRDNNIQSCLPLEFTEEQFRTEDTQ